MKTVQVKSSFPFLSILALIFIGLKLAGIGVVATWSWWWVLAPIWIPASFGLSILLLVGILAAIAVKR